MERRSFLKGALALPLVPGSAWAQAAPDELTYSQKQVFRIPFQADPGPPHLKEVQLYYSTDQGRTWQKVGGLHQ